MARALRFWRQLSGYERYASVGLVTSPVTAVFAADGWLQVERDTKPSERILPPDLRYGGAAAMLVLGGLVNILAWPIVPVAAIIWFVDEGAQSLVGKINQGQVSQDPGPTR